MLLQGAYRFDQSSPLSDDQILGAPDWINTDNFDVEGKAKAADGAMPTEQMKKMVQALLEDRFDLKARPETRQLSVYDLVVG